MLEEGGVKRLNFAYFAHLNLVMKFPVKILKKWNLHNASIWLTREFSVPCSVHSSDGLVEWSINFLVKWLVLSDSVD